MPVVAIVPDHDCGLDTEYLSVALYLTDRRFAFVAVEAAIRPREACAGLVLVLDGTPPTDTELVKLQASGNFRELLTMSQCVTPPHDGVWDFRATFFDENLHTNRAYEGPPEWRCITTVQDDLRVRFLGQDADVPTLTQRRFESRGGLSSLRITGQLAADRLAVLRVGFFLTRHELEPLRLSGFERALQRLAAYRPRSRFVTRLYTYRTADEPALQSLNVRSRLKRARLALTLKPFVDATGGKVSPEIAATPTSDIWLVGYGRNSLDLLAPEVSLDQPSSRAGWGLPTQRDEDLQSAFYDLHVQPGAFVTEWLGVHWLEQPECDPRYEIRWEAELPGLTIRQMFVPTMALLALAGFVLAATAATQWRPWVLAATAVAYAGLIVLVYMRNHQPRLRRFFEHAKRPGS